MLEAGLKERSMSPHAAPIMIFPIECKPGASLAEGKRLVIDYCALNKQMPKVPTTQAKSKLS